MQLSSILWAVFRFLIPPTIITLIYLYYLPAITGCGFPDAKRAQAACYLDETKRPYVPAEIAPFRLLAFGDPQLEGDTSFRGANPWEFPSLAALGTGDFRDIDLSASLKGLFTHDIPRVLQNYRKRLDLWGNDLYLAHIYRTVNWWTKPTHAVVLGDLLGSQWISDEEFRRRSDRFWNRVFKRATKVPNSITGSSGNVERLSEDGGWRNRLIALPGNHDIGYAGDIDQHRVDRFEDAFGGVNWEIRFRLNDSTTPELPSFIHAFGSSPLTRSSPELRVVILNSMNLDGPAHDNQLQDQSRDFLFQELHAKPIPRNTATVLLTHIPLYKDEGVCIDGPFFDYFSSEEGGGIKEQNHLSQYASDLILSGLVGPQRDHQAVVVNGHDHWGCHSHHYPSLETSDDNTDGSKWDAIGLNHAYPIINNNSIPGVREITVRSMMGSFGGNVGLLSGWYDHDESKWKFQYDTCQYGVQHIWWGIHGLAALELFLFVASVATAVLDEVRESRKEAQIAASTSKAKKA